jgi:L-2-hydroxyglutarate oxidase LhgO
MQVVVIGAGVVGLAVGAELARRGVPPLLLEQHGGPGREASSRNSEVIHAGLYYPQGSLKAELCVEGRERLYHRCAELRIPHRRTGKLVVAVDSAEIATLEEMLERGLRNGAGALELIEAREIQRREPRVRGIAALWSPDTGIVDSHALMSSYEAELVRDGGEVVYDTEVTGLERAALGWRVDTVHAQGEVHSMAAEVVVNAAGLCADRIAERAGLDVDALDLRHRPCKGDYFSVAPSLGALTRHLVYPVPVPGGLGIHVTLDLGGRFRLGPDVEWVGGASYEVDPGKADAFARAASRYLPELRAEHLTPAFAGIRPKLSGAGEPARDFHIGQELPGLVNLLGIESPGLTAAGAIAARVADLIA